MKVVIIEGMDNTGKTTVIHGLMEKYDRVLYMHATKPKEADPIKCAIEQKKYFHQMVESIKNVEQSRFYVDLIILDRSWVGEYVYGCLYRGNGDDYVKDMISECYDNLSHISRGWYNLDFSTILYTASPEFCAKNDDGNSISEGRIEAIKKEGERFEEIIKSDVVIGKKGIINVENDGKFLSKEEILQMTLNIINDHREVNNVGMLYIQGVREELLSVPADDEEDETEDLTTDVNDNGGKEEDNEEEEA